MSIIGASKMGSGLAKISSEVGMKFNIVIYISSVPHFIQ